MSKRTLGMRATERATRRTMPALTPQDPVEIADRSMLRTSRLVLRPLREPDREAFIAMVRRSREELERWMPLHEEGEDDDALFDRQLTLTNEGEATGRALRRVGVLDSGELVGAFNLVHIVRGLTLEADANWWVDAAHAGRGLATEGVQALVDFALADLPHGLGLTTVVAGIVPDNLPSQRVAARVGFERQPGITSYLRSGGRWHRHEIWTANASSEVRSISA
ncbi:MAG: GNAT family N-acetyltransferase [Phycisphaerales bacterium JB037]